MRSMMAGSRRFVSGVLDLSAALVGWHLMSDKVRLSGNTGRQEAFGAELRNILLDFIGAPEEDLHPGFLREKIDTFGSPEFDWTWRRN